MEAIGGTQKKSPIVLALEEVDSQIDGCQDICNRLQERLQSILNAEVPETEVEKDQLKGDSTIEQRINTFREAISRIKERLNRIIDRLQI